MRHASLKAQVHSSHFMPSPVTFRECSMNLHTVCMGIVMTFSSTVYFFKKNNKTITHICADCEQINELRKVHAEETCFSFLAIAVKVTNLCTVLLYYTCSLFTSGGLYTVNSEQNISYTDRDRWPADDHCKRSKMSFGTKWEIIYIVFFKTITQQFYIIIWDSMIPLFSITNTETLISADMDTHSVCFLYYKALLKTQFYLLVAAFYGLVFLYNRPLFIAMPLAEAIKSF